MITKYSVHVYAIKPEKTGMIIGLAADLLTIFPTHWFPNTAGHWYIHNSPTGEYKSI